MVENADDIIEELESIVKSKITELRMNLPEPRQTKRVPIKIDAAEQPAARAEQPILSYITDQPVCIDTLVEKTRMDISQISGILVSLQIQGVISALPGKSFVRRNEPPHG